jgi:prepilin peptidase CpaA
MIIATATDLWRGTIYNWTTYTGILVALGLSATATLMNRGDLSIGIQSSVVGFLSCGFIMLICFVLFQIGGGDVKLLAMVGAFLGAQLGVETLLWTFVIGGAAAVIILIWKIGLVKLVKRLVQQLLLRMNFGSFDPLSEEEKKQMQLPLYLAPSALLATVVVKFSLVEYFGNWLWV